MTNLEKHEKIFKEIYEIEIVDEILYAREYQSTDDIIKVLKKIKREQAKRKLRMNGDYKSDDDFVFCEKDGRYYDKQKV